MTVHKLAAIGAGGTQNAVAQLDIALDGIITAIHGVLINNGAAAGDEVIAEISFLSVSTIAANDTRGSLFSLGNRISGAGAVTGVNSGVGGLTIPVNAGERIFLHLVATAAISSSAEINIYVEDGAGLQVATRRR